MEYGNMTINPIFRVTSYFSFEPHGNSSILMQSVDRPLRVDKTKRSYLLIDITEAQHLLTFLWSYKFHRNCVIFSSA